jgi:hypothetical protein
MRDVKWVLMGLPILEPWLLEKQIEEGAATEKTERESEEAPQPSVDLRGLLVDLTGCDGTALG